MLDSRKMKWTALFTCLLTVCLMNQVSGLENVTGIYGDTVEIPCNKGLITEQGVSLVKWKNDKDGNILVKNVGHNASISDNYKNRASIKQDYSLVIKQVTMADQKTFTCMVVKNDDILEYPMELVIYKIPSLPQIENQTAVMAIGKLTLLAVCRSEAANPAATISWFKNKTPLKPDETAIKVTSNVVVDNKTGLSTTLSKLEYTAVKGDIDAKFTCQVQHSHSANMDSSPLVFSVNYPTEKVTLQVVSQGPFKEGDNVTLKCIADGNPPPSSYNFYIKGEKKMVNSNTFTLTSVTRANTGDYNCSLVDNEKMAASLPIKVEFLDVVFSSTGKISKKLGESFETTVGINSSGDAQTSCKKGNDKISGLPKFDKLTYLNSGAYECVVSVAGLTKRYEFELLVQGSPVISGMTKKRGEGTSKVVSCIGEGSPKPTVQWTVNGTNVDGGLDKGGKFTYHITFTPKVAVNVSCIVTNALGSQSRTLLVTSLFDDVTMDKQDQKKENGDKTALAVGIVVGLMVAALAIGLAYWLYLKKFRQGSWKTGEKEDGSAEESKKLEENQSQKTEA